MLFSAVANFSLFTLHSSLCMAQTDTRMREVLSQAESDYRIGRIEQARDALLQELHNFRGSQKQNALRLIALSYLARFDMEHTQQYATQMLQENPYYTPSASDPATFADMVNGIKAGMTATITTASSQAKSHDAHHGADDSRLRRAQPAGGAGCLCAGHESHRL